MNYNYLRYFSVLAQLEHYTLAAARLEISQPSLSSAIRSLENELGVKLFDRVGRTLQLSEVGKQYFSYVNEALIALDNGESALGDYKEDYQQSVSVAMPISSVWSNLIHGFHKKYHHYSMRQITCEQNQFRSLLTDQKMKGVAVIYVGEDLDVLLELCDRILVLCAGKVSGIVPGRGAKKRDVGMMMTRLGGNSNE